ncbi:glycoside hydrolase family 108 protein [Ideonella sp.]|jgi:lysozyme family protein|uniref:glycoside hydrolase family 108 protein n=1 Tax=Ideonella sp. TaxID=1929293 RepID=UPI0037BFC3A0
MAQFQLFFPTLLRFEGGFVNDPHDPGGATNMGITLATFKRYAKPLLGVLPSLDNLRELTERQAAKIYKVEYWDRTYGDDISLQPLADIVFDFHVNAGSHAIVCLYQVLNAAGANHAVAPTMTPDVVATLEHHDMVQIYTHYKDARRAYYLGLVQQHPALRRYLRGWLARVDAFPVLTPAATGLKPPGSACPR